MAKNAAKLHVIVVIGPNGAGRFTSAPHFLRDALEVAEFVNADAIAACGRADRFRLRDDSGRPRIGEVPREPSDDRIEIMNPAGAFGTLTPENFGQPSSPDYRNP